jgi:hypothetical protein
MNFRRFVRCSLVVGVLAIALGAAPPAPAQSVDASLAKVMRLMHDDAYNYVNSRSPSVWSIHFTGKHLNDVKVILAVSTDPGTDLMVVFVTVAEKRRLPVTTDFMRKLLEENHALDRVKVG